MAIATWMSHIPFLVALFTSALGEGLLCGPTQEVKLHSSGRASALSLTLSSGDEGAPTLPCTLSIFAPNVYALSLRIIDAENPFEVFKDEPVSKWRLRRKSEKMSNAVGKNKTVDDCTLQVFYLDPKRGSSSGSAAVTVSPCAPGLVLGPLEMLPQPIRVQWWPPKPPKKRTDHLRLVVTAVNAGEDCMAKDQVVCLRVGEDPLLCVSESLACDGVRHCPEGGADETRALCDVRRASWAEELVKRLASRHGELLGLDDMQFIPEDVTVNVSVVPKREKKITALEAALAPYGPWGYLLLGTLICAMMMVLFAIWECFCHHIKTPQAPVPPDCEAPAAVVMGSPQRPPRRPTQGRGPPPPTYEELEQPPPPYSVLFPRANKTSAITEEDLTEATTSTEGIL